MEKQSDHIDGYEGYQLLGLQKWYLHKLDGTAEVLARLHVDPNQLTLLGIGFAVWAAFHLGVGSWITALPLMLAAAVADMLDGPVDRAITRLGKTRKQLTKLIGAIIDPIADRACDIALLGGLMWYAGTRLGFIWCFTIFWTMVAYLLSSWLRTFMRSNGYMVIHGKPLTRTIFFVGLLVVCIALALQEHYQPIPSSVREELWIILAVIVMSSAGHMPTLGTKHLQTTIFIGVLIVIVGLVLEDLYQPTSFSMKEGILIIAATTVLPLFYRLRGAIRAVLRAHNQQQA